MFKSQNGGEMGMLYRRFTMGMFGLNFRRIKLILVEVRNSRFLF
jgi:hypothetical protein